MSAPTIAVQIVNYKTRAYLAQCLLSVTEDLVSSDLTYCVNVLESASGDRLDEMVEGYPHARLFESEVNGGFGAGHNFLASQTDATYLLILNPDVEFIETETSARLLHALSDIPSASAVGPKLVDVGGNPQRWDHGRLHGVRAQIALRGGHSHWQASDRRQEVAWVSGAVMLISRDAFGAVGGFDERFFLYKEDEDLCLRLRRGGAKVVYEPSVTVRHLGSVVAQRDEELARSERYFIEKNLDGGLSQRLFEKLHRGLPYLRL
jgi:N-acetylglucosaminyl-diphospho-decaprenol L-rhamnosyltransferase